MTCAETPHLTGKNERAQAQASGAHRFGAPTGDGVGGSRTASHDA